MNVTRMTCIYAAATALLFAASAAAQNFATGDSRNVTEPVFPAVCQTVTAAYTEVNNSIISGVDSHRRSHLGRRNEYQSGRRRASRPR